MLRICKAYRTISTAALCVIAGTIPIDLVIREKSSLYHLRKGRKFQHHSTLYEPQPQQAEKEIEEMKCKIRRDTLKKWQQEWDEDQKGRLTYKFYGNIEERLNADWIHQNHYTVQILSGHGNFKGNLKKLGQTETETCTCGQIDTVQDVIFECNLLQGIRNKLEDESKAQIKKWPCEYRDLVSKEMYSTFQTYVTEAIKLRD